VLVLIKSPLAMAVQILYLQVPVQILSQVDRMSQLLTLLMAALIVIH
jgi:hypothetical protein